MTPSTLDAFVLVAQAALLLFLGTQLYRRLHTGEDFTLARRRIEMPLSAATLAINSVPLWWLLIVVGTAYVFGRAALWLALALWIGVAAGGWFVAPRLRALTNLQQRGSFVELIVADAGEKMRALLIRSANAILVLLLLAMAVALLQLTATLLSHVLGLPFERAVIMLALAVAIALLLGGLWIAVYADVWQLSVWAGLSVALLIALVVALRATPAPVLLHGSYFAGNEGFLTLSFTVGVGFICAQMAGNAPLLTRYMACASDADLSRARRFALAWSAVALATSLALGLGFRALAGARPLTANFDAASLVRTLESVLPSHSVSVIAIILVCAIALAIGNCVQTAAAHIANDSRRGGAAISLGRARLAALLLCTLAAALSIYLAPESPSKHFERLLFAWHALGAAFGPLLIVRLSGKRVRAGSTLGSMWSGFILSIVFYLMPDTPGELLERGLPFTAALGIALSGGERRRNPDRADRGERTVHDRLPI